MKNKRDYKIVNINELEMNERYGPNQEQCYRIISDK